MRSETGKPVRALLVIDCQNDFIPSEDGSLAVPDAEAVLPVINKLRSKEFDFVYLCLDWHPYNHCSFRTNNPGANLFEVVHLPTTGSAQIMWPDHCVQGTHGAELHKDLKVEVSDIYTYAGCNPQRDSYSVFKDNGSTVLTEMRDLLEESGVTEIYAVGLATDYCVQYTLLDAKSLLQGVEIFYIQDGCRGISDAGVKSAIDAFKSEKVHIVVSDGPEVKAIADRKIRIDGGLELTKRNDRVAMFSEVDRIYESIVFRTAQGKAWEEDLAHLVRSVIVNQLCSWSGRNALHACCEMGDFRTLEHLIRIAGKGLNLGMRTRKDENALMLAIQSKSGERRVDIVRLLLETADEPQLRELIFGQSLQFRLSALMFACREGLPEIVELLLAADSSSSLQLKSAFGKTALMFACMSNTHEHAAVVELLLRSQAKVEDRFAMLYETDKERWNSLHFSAKSGSFARIDWARALDGYENMARLPVNTKTHAGITFLHLAAFNGRSEVIRALLDNCAPNRKRRMMEAILKKGLRHRVKVNVAIKGSGHTELDLAIQRRHLECARLLLRLGCYAGTSSQEQMQELLHRLVLMGDVEACESILNFADENRVTIDDALVETTQRIEHPETCTVSFANRTDPVAQFLYKCTICDSMVCLVCKDRCHGPGACRAAYSKLDFEHFPDKDWELCGVIVSQCACDRDTCCATAATDVREIEGYRFIPHPVRTSSVHLTADLLRLSHTIARNMHNVWAQGLSGLGWQYGRDKDPEEKLHPHLLPFDSLSIEGAKYNMDMSVETLKVILSLGYEIVRQVNAPRFGRIDTVSTNVSTSHKTRTARLNTEGKAQTSAVLSKALSMMADDSDKRRKLNLGVTTSELHAGAAKFAEFAWDPLRPDCMPLDTSGFDLSDDLETLSERIASNSHEVWASEKIRQGWRYAPSRNIRKDLKLNASLVPYYVLTREEKEQLLEGARETMKVILMSGWLVRAKEKPEEDGSGAGANTSDQKVKVAGSDDEDDEDDIANLSRGGSGGSGGSGSNNNRRGGELVTTSRMMVPLRRRDTTQPTRSTLAFRQLKLIRRKLFNQYLFAAVRRGQIHSVNILLSKRSSMHVGANLNAIDEFGHTPLYIAIKRGQLATTKRLLALGANLELRDINGLTPLALCAYLGNLKLCQELVQNQARILVCDAMGFTPLHLAAHQGHVEVCKYLTERLQQEHQSNEIVDLNADMVDYANLGGIVEKETEDDDCSDDGETTTFGRSRRSLRSGVAAGASSSGQAQNKWKLFRIMFRSRGVGTERSKVARIIPADGLTDSNNWNSKQVDHVSPLRRMPSRQGSRATAVSDAGLSQAPCGPAGRSYTTELQSSHTTQKLLRAGSDLAEPVGQPTLSEYPPMSLAVQSDNIEIVELLIKYGSNPMLADGPTSRGTMFSPYVRALLRHIEMCAKVEYLQDKISKRALYDLQKASTVRSTQRKQSHADGDIRRGRGGSMRLSASSLMAMDTERGGGISMDHPSADYAEPSLTNRSRAGLPGAMTPKALGQIGLPGRKHFGMVKRFDTRIGNLFGFMGGEAQGSSDRVVPDQGGAGGSQSETPQVSSTRELDQLLEKAQEERAQAARMVEVMNQSSKVSAWRRRTAIKMCVKETSLLLILIISFGCLVQLSPDYGIAEEGQWAEHLRGYLTTSTAEIDSPSSFLAWVENDFAGRELSRADNRTAWQGANFVFGGIKLEMYEHDALESVNNTQLTDLNGIDTSVKVQTLILPQEPPEALANRVAAQTATWAENDVYVLSLQFNLYNPFFEVYGIAQVRYIFSFVGLYSTEVEFKPFRLHYGRFPPSRPFQLAVLSMVICFTLTKLRSWLRSRHRSRRGKTEEWVIEFLLLGILLFDVYVYEMTKDVEPDYASSEWQDLTQAFRLLEVERRFFAVYFLLSVVPLLKATQTIPSIGPVVVALLSTMTNTAVLIYLLVFWTACFLLTLTFHVGFGISVAEFATMVSTFESLFLTPFVETWDGIMGSAHSSYLGAALSVFYILFATISLNLLIAIVTDVYPNARAASDREWEEIITSGIEDSLRDLLHSQNISQKDLRIETWAETKLLTGRDGRKHWVASDAGNEDDEDAAVSVDADKSTNDKLAALSEQIRQLTSIVESLRAASVAES